jgi:uncharacterized protein (DUF1697 family)
VQSGNVVFETTSKPVASLARQIAEKITSDFSFLIPVFLRTAKEWENIARRNPFRADPAIDQTKLHVTFLSNNPPKAASELLQPLLTKPEQFYLVDREIYLYCPNGYGNTKLSNTAIEKKLSIGATTRNWKTVNTLLAMMDSGKKTHS